MNTTTEPPGDSSPSTCPHCAAGRDCTREAGDLKTAEMGQQGRQKPKCWQRLSLSSGIKNDLFSYCIPLFSLSSDQDYFLVYFQLEMYLKKEKGDNPRISNRM